MTAELTRGEQAGLLSEIHRYWRILLKWRWIAVLFFAAPIVLALLYAFLRPAIYTASGSVWIEDAPNILPFEDVEQTGNAASNIQSHVRLLRSRALAASTIEKLKLYENPIFAGKTKKGEPPRDPNDPIFREHLIKEFLDNLSASSAPATRLVDVRFSSRNPRLAADILNTLFDAYIEMLVRKKYSASEKATAFLNEQIEGLRQEIAEREKKLNEYGSQRDILPLTAAEAPTVGKIADVSKALTEATIERINKLSFYNQLKAAPLGEVPDAPEGSLIQRLREQYISLSRQYKTRLTMVRPEYPEMQRLKADLDSATEALQNETENLTRKAYNEYETALRKEQSLQALLGKEKDEAYKANSNSVVYNSLRIELENRKQLLESLSKRQSETDVSSRLKGLEALNVWLVDKADYPLSPASPKRKKILLMGLVLGLAGGLGSALGLEFLNHSVRTSKDIAKAIGVPVLGSIPAFESEAGANGLKVEFARIFEMMRGGGEKSRPESRAKARSRSAVLKDEEASGSREDRQDAVRAGGKISLIALREPQSIQAESYRSIRTTLLVSSPPGKIRTILFTSPLAREGKSSTVSNLAITLAECGKSVVIIDSDLRKPKQARIFGIRDNGEAGLSRFLNSSLDPAAVALPTEVPGLRLITSGPHPANPIELLSSDKMDSLIIHLKNSFDYIFFDTPPLLAVSDALALAPLVDAIILIARGGQTPIPALKQAKQRLDSHRLRCLGVILNGVDLVEQDGYYARQYYRYAKDE